MPSTGVTARRAARRRGGRATPYSDQKRDRNTAPDFLEDHSPTSDQLEVLKDLVSRTWHLHYISPLWQLDTSTAKLRSYSQLLTAHLAAEGGDGDGAVATHSRGEATVPRHTAKVMILPRFGLDGSDAMQVIVRQRTSQRDSPALVALLCSVNEPRHFKEGFTSLPLLLLRGPSQLSRLVLQWLQSMFDCHVSPGQLSQEELTMLVGQYATAEKVSRGMGSVELLYSLPLSVKQAGLSTIALELPYESAVTVWKSTEQAGDRRQAFVQALRSLIHTHFHFKLESLTLSRISTPVLHAEGTGRIKFTSIDCIIPVLSVLQCSSA